MRDALGTGSRLALIAAVALGVAGGIACLGSGLDARAGDGLMVEGDVATFGEAPAGSETVVTVRLRNRSSRPIRVLGASAFCHKTACFEATGLPIAIPAGGEGAVTLHVTARAEGDFEGAITVFTDRPGRTEFPLKVRGRVVPGGAGS